MTPEQARYCGMSTKEIQLTDEELEQQIAVLDIVISYLRGRGDADIICATLIADFNTFQNLQDARRAVPQLLSSKLATINTETVFNP
jgi:hypothetical protein